MIGLNKTHLRKTLKTSLVSYEEFNTVLAEVESVVNCRPLTYVGDELHCEEPLTPSHLLVGYKLNALPVPEELLEHDATYRDPVKVNKRYKYLLSLIAKFQSAWSKDYLLSLKQSWNVSNRPDVKVGDVVLIEDDGPRLRWKLGIIKTLYTSPDGHTRSVLLSTSRGEITRVVIHLYPLEIHSNLYDPSDPFPPTEAPQTSASPPERPLRRAHVLAKQRIRAILSDEE